MVCSGSIVVSLTIALITDIHHGPDSPTVQGTAALGLLERSLAHLAGASPDLLIDLGDRLTDVGSDIDRRRLTEVAKLFASFPCPRQHLRGNHDLLPLETQQRLLGGSLGSRSLDLANRHLVFLDSFDGTIGGALSASALRWLASDLASTSLPTVVFSHQPLDGLPLVGNPIFEVDYAAEAHPDGHTEARRIMEAAGTVALAVNGHTHWNHAVEVGGIPYLSVQSLVARDSAGAPAGAYALLRIGEHACEAEIFGREPAVWRWDP